MESKRVIIKKQLNGDINEFLLESKVKTEVDKLDITDTTRSMLLSKLYRKTKENLIELQGIKGNKLITLI